MMCQHCHDRSATYRVSATETSPEYVVCAECAPHTSEFATLTPLGFVPLSARPFDEREAIKDRANQCGPADARTVPFDTGKPHGPTEYQRARYQRRLAAPEGAEMTWDTRLVPLPVHGPQMAPMLRVYRTRFFEDDVIDGDFPRDDTTEETIICTPDDLDIEDGLTAVDIAAQWLRDNGLTETAGADWFYDPDGSTIVSYGTGEREEASAHPRGFTDEDLARLFETVSTL